MLKKPTKGKLELEKKENEAFWTENSTQEGTKTRNPTQETSKRDNKPMDEESENETKRKFMEFVER